MYLYRKQRTVLSRTAVLLVLFSVCQSSWGDFPNIIPNPNFMQVHGEGSLPLLWERKAQGENTQLALESDGHGDNNSISILGNGLWKCKIGDIKPGQEYFFSFWIKRDGWEEGEYPTINIFDHEIYLNELFSWGGWLKLSWILSSAGCESTSLKLVNPGMTHKLWFDDFFLTEFRVDLLTPCRGEVINTSTPTVSWSMPDNDHILEIKIEFSRNERFQGMEILDTVSPLGNSYQIRQGLSDGHWYWKIKVYNNQDVIAISPVSFFTVKSHVVPPRHLEEVNRGFIKNNLKRSATPDYFPIGIYGVEKGAISEIKEAGFNSIQCPFSDEAAIKDYISAAEEMGLKVLLSLPEETGENDVTTSNFLITMRNSSSVLAWYLEDEPEARAVPPSYIWKLGRYVQNYDPFHPTALAILRSKKVKDYGPAVDVIMVDPYPIPRKPLTWLSDSIEEARRSLNGNKAVWAVVQAFNWEAYPGGEKKRTWGRNPTYDEMRCLTYLSIIHGVKGIFYYTFKDKYYSIKNDHQHWANIKKVVRELNFIYPLLLAPYHYDFQTCSLSNKKHVHCTVRMVDKELSSKFGERIPAGNYLIALNVCDEPVWASITPPASCGNMAKLLLGEGANVLRGGRLREYFNPYEVKIYYFPNNDVHYDAGKNSLKY